MKTPTEPSKSQTLQATGSDAGERLDLFLAKSPALKWSRTRCQRLIEAGQVTVNEEEKKVSYRLRPGDQICIVPDEEPVESIDAQPLPLEIVYEDEAVAVVNKPRDLVVHPAPGHPDGTLVNALLHHLDRLSPIGAPLRPGIVHRLDKDTTGLMAVAKTEDAHRFLEEEIRQRRMKRRYLALVHGRPEVERGQIEAAIGRHPQKRKRMAVRSDGKPARTYFRLLRTATYDQERFSLLGLWLETGRTHQIRVHLEAIGLPVVGDPVYNAHPPPWQVGGQLLHAGELRFHHPRSQLERRFSIRPPADFTSVIRSLEIELEEE